MKKLFIPFITSILLLQLSCSLSAQTNTFSKVFYNAGSTNGYSVVQAEDKGYLIAGANDGNAFVMKIDSAGNYLWSEDFGISGNDRFNKIISTNDSCFILAGTICVKINSVGDTLWSKSIGSGDYEEAYSIEQTTDHGYILTGAKNNTSPPYNSILVLKLDSTGNLQWKKNITIGTNSNFGYAVRQIPDGGYLILGALEGGAPSYLNNSILIKLSSTGTTIWSKTYNRSAAVYSFPVDMEIVHNGVVLYLTINNQVTLLKTDFSGTILWNKTYSLYGGGNCLNCSLPKIHSTSDGGYVLVNGATFGLGGQDLHKVDSVGNPLWSQNLFLYPIDAIESTDKGFFVLGNGPLGGLKSETYNPQIGIIKTDSLGNGFNCTNNNSWYSFSNDSLIGTSITASGMGGGTIIDVYPVLSTPSIIDYLGCVSFVGGIKKNKSENTISISPNPFTNETTITFADGQKNTSIKIMDVLGKDVYSVILPALSRSFIFVRGQLKEGIYFVQVQSEKGTINKKIIIQ